MVPIVWKGKTFLLSTILCTMYVSTENPIGAKVISHASYDVRLSRKSPNGTTHMEREIRREKISQNFEFRFILWKIAKKIFKKTKITHMLNIHISMGCSRIVHFHIVQMRRNDLLRHRSIRYGRRAVVAIKNSLKQKCEISSAFWMHIARLCLIYAKWSSLVSHPVHTLIEQIFTHSRFAGHTRNKTGMMLKVTFTYVHLKVNEENKNKIEKDIFRVLVIHNVSRIQYWHRRAGLSNRCH